MILCRLRETGSKMLHKSLPSHPRERNLAEALFSFYTVVAKTLDTLCESHVVNSKQVRQSPGLWGEMHLSEALTVQSPHLRCLPVPLAPDTKFPKLFRKMKISLVQKYFLLLKCGISFQALCCALAAGPIQTIIHSAIGCTQSSSIGCCLKPTQNRSFIQVKREIFSGRR